MLLKDGESKVSKFCKGFSVIGAIGLVVMMFLITIDVAGRFFFDKPFIGTYEIVEFLMIIVIFLAFPYGQVKKQHVNVELFSQLLKGRSRAVLDSFTYLAGFVMFVMVTYAAIKQTLKIFEAEQSSQVLLIPQWPVVAVMAIGIALFTLVLLLDLFTNLRKIIRDDDGSK